MTVCRGVRGATTVVENNALEILAATRELLAMMIRLNGIEAEDVASGIFTTTQDQVAVYPATAARQLGWMSVPLLCGHEMAVPDGLPRCVRILLHWNTDRSQDEIHHVYLKEAVQLRPDQSELPPVNMQQLNQWVDDQMRKHGGA